MPNIRSSRGLLDRPVFFDPYTGEVTHENPVPQRAFERRQELRHPNKAVDLCGVGVVDWDAVQGYVADWETRGKASELAAFVMRFRLTSKVAGPASIRDCFYAQNEKTRKARKATGRKGQIVGLSLFPHFYANLLNAVPEVFLDENGVVDVPQYKEESPAFAYYSEIGGELRAFFNSFDGADPANIEEQTGVRPADRLNFCVGSSPACRTTCLVLTGNNPASTPAVAKKANLTQAFLTNPALFVAGLYVGMDYFSRAQAKQGIDTVVRLNMLSDIPWYAVCPELLEDLADPQRGPARVYWYDYTKLAFWQSPAYRRLGERIGLRPGEVLDLTFSFSGSPGNTRLCREALGVRDDSLGYPDGIRIAMAFAPADASRRATVEGRTTWEEILTAGARSGLIARSGRQVVVSLPEIGSHLLVDGDDSDYRIDDPGGCIVALNFKEPMITEESVPGWSERLRGAREVFSAKVPDVEGVPTLDPSVLPRKNPRGGLLTVLNESPYAATGDAPEALAAGEIQYPMFQVGGILIGPHVPTVLED